MQKRKKQPKSQSTMVLEIVRSIAEKREQLRELKRSKVLNAAEQAAVLTVFFGDGPASKVQSPEQQKAILDFLFE